VVHKDGLDYRGNRRHFSRLSNCISDFRCDSAQTHGEAFFEQVGFLVEKKFVDFDVVQDR